MKYFGILIVVVYTLAGCQSGPNSNLTIATAANMQFAMEALTKGFESSTGVSCHMVVGSSGKLTAQLKEGAPYDVFVAANLKYPNAVYEAGLAHFPAKVYALGALVLWSMDEDLTPSLEVLTDPGIHHIAIANPKTAPYGLAAEETLKAHGLFPILSHKLVFGESISQTNQYIVSKSAEIGFTSLSVVKSLALSGKGKWTLLDEKDYSPIEQGVVVIDRKADQKPEAMLFYEYLFSKEAQRILEDYGYKIPAGS